MAPDESKPHSRRIAPIYGSPTEDGVILLYAGELELQGASASGRHHGQLELRLHPDPDLKAHFAGSGIDLLRFTFAGVSEVAVPAGASLAPPPGSTLPQRVEGASWTEDWLGPTALSAGDLSSVERLVVHFAGPIEPRFRALTRLEGGGAQGQFRFELPGWRLVLAPVDEDARDDRWFSGAIEASPTDDPLDPAEVDRLGYRLFLLLSLIASREVGVGPVCGLDSTNKVVWAHWDVPRMRRGRGAGWCPRHLIPTALPELAAGLTELAADRATEAVFERAVESLLFADSGEVLDVRIPIACSGLELLAWALLRRDGWIDQDTSLRLRAAAAAVRLLLRWAGIPADIPDEFGALVFRRQALGESGWGGPEVVFNVRNGLIHPPKDLDDAQWPSHDALIESWQLSTWYLQLVILRLLGYAGEHRSLLQIGGSEMRTEPVPWFPESP